jgi:sugar lactone lactonase YvrE
VWVTDSANAQLFELPIGERGGLPRRSEVRRVPLGGAWVQATGNNANGITQTPDGRALLVVNSSSGVLYRVNTRSGAAKPVDLGGALLTNGDGLLLEGNRLFAVQNRLDRIAVVRMSDDGRTGRVKRTIADADTDVPSTVARAGNRLFLPNARFTTQAGPTTPYWVTGIGVRQRNVTS